MKTFLTLLFTICTIAIINAQVLELPFFDDFSNNYENWATYSISGGDIWHISGDDGIDGSKCARFYRTENPPEANDDWLVSAVFNTEDLSVLIVEFKFLCHSEGTTPEFYYSTSFSGDVSTTNWTELDNSFWNNNWNWNDAQFEIDAPEDSFVFAVRYQSTTESANYILIDNFSIEAYTPPAPMELVATNDHFEFYTNIPEESGYWQEIENELDSMYQKYCGIWNIEGKEEFIDKNIKTTIYYSEKSTIPFVNSTTPETKSGFFDRQSKSIYLSPLDTPEKQTYYGNMKGLAINTFAGYAKKHQLFRDDGYDVMPDYYIEGFGLYEQGFRPRLDSIISFRSKHPDDLTHDDLNEMNVFSGTSQKDIIVSYVEGQIIGLLDYFGAAPYGSYEPIWNNHLVYFYDTTDVVRIKKYASSENFDIYCSSRDTMFIDSFFVWMDRTRQFYIDSFQIEINRKYNLVIYYDEKTGMDMTGYGHWNGGAGGLNISPHNFWGGFDDGYDWLLSHEFGHVFNSVIYPEMPGGFYHEGMANFSGYKMAGDEHRDDLWKIQTVFDFYQQEYSREPTLEEFISDSDKIIDCYFFGFEFIRYLRKNEGYLKIKEFFVNKMDFSVFDESYNELESGYINYLKSLIDQNYPEIITNSGIFIERGSSAVITTKNLSASDQEAVDEGLFFEIITEPTKGHIAKINNPGKPIAKFTEQDIKDEQIIYVNDSTSATSDFFTFVVSDEALTAGVFQFDITLTNPTAILDFAVDKKDCFKIYPNPVTNKSLISFQTRSTGKVNLSIYDVQGRKICTLLNNKMNAGKHTIPVSNLLPTGGIYICKLVSVDGISAKRLIIKE